MICYFACPLLSTCAVTFFYAYCNYYLSIYINKCTSTLLPYYSSRYIGITYIYLSCKYYYVMWYVPSTTLHKISTYFVLSPSTLQKN